MQIVSAKKSDIPAIIPIWKKLMDEGGRHDEIFRLNKDWKKLITSHLERLLKDKKSKVLVAKEGKAVIGYAIIQIIQNIPVFKQFERGFITDLCVDENYRSKGIGEMMMKKIFAWFKSKGMERMELTVLEKNAGGRKFWKRMGFQDYMHRMHARV